MPKTTRLLRPLKIANLKPECTCLCSHFNHQYWNLYFNFLAEQQVQDISARGKKNQKGATQQDGWDALVRACHAMGADDQSIPQDADMAFGQFVGFRLKAMTEDRKNRCMAEILKSLTASSMNQAKEVKTSH